MECVVQALHSAHENGKNMNVDTFQDTMHAFMKMRHIGHQLDNLVQTFMLEKSGVAATTVGAPLTLDQWKTSLSPDVKEKMVSCLQDLKQTWTTHADLFYVLDCFTRHYLGAALQQSILISPGAHLEIMVKAWNHQCQPPQVICSASGPCLQRACERFMDTLVDTLLTEGTDAELSYS